MTRPLRVAIVGVGGRLGRAAVAALSRERDLELVGRFGSRDDWRTGVRELGVDVALEATRAGLGAVHGLALLEAGARVVIGTSGIKPEEGEELDRRARSLGLGGLIVPNFSLASALLMRTCAELAQHFPAAEIVELHHADKPDAPSGTALETARRMQAARGGEPRPVPTHSVRLPGLYAHQEVLFGSRGELLTVRHDLFSTEAFEPGIVAAVRYAARAQGVARGIEHAFARTA